MGSIGDSATATVICPRISEVEPGDWECAVAAFGGGPVWEMCQAWLPRAEAGFRPGRVRFGHREGTLWILAELEDEDIFTEARRNQEYLWTLGDTFEMFLRTEGQEQYHELHVSPSNLTLQLKFPNAMALKTCDPQTLLVHDALMRTWTRVDNGAAGWWVLAALDLEALAGKEAAGSGAGWVMSFSRYDYTRGRAKPVISSTSMHSSGNFHTQGEWRRVRLG